MVAACSAPNRALDRRVARGRFAPSPTGPLHFGSLIAALGSFLEARRNEGEWLLRIEDVDTPRVLPGAADAILRALERYGLHWDGPVVYQSRRTAQYQAALESLARAQGWSIPAACSRRELALCPRGRDGGPIYPGTCRGGVRPSNRPCALRLRVERRADHLSGRRSGRLPPAAGPRGRRFRAPPRRWSVHLSTGGGGGRRRAGRHPGGARRRPARFHPPADCICNGCWGCPRPTTRICRWRWMPAATS